MKKLLFVPVLFLCTMGYTATKSVVPQANAEGGIGISSCAWYNAYFSSSVQAGTFVGSGAQLTNLPASSGALSITSGTVIESNINAKQSLTTGATQGAMIDLNYEAERTFGVTISSPYTVIGSTHSITKSLSFAVGISTTWAQIAGGTNVVYIIDQRPDTDILTAGTQILNAPVTVSTKDKTGGVFNDNTMPANNSIFLCILSVSGDVRSFTLKGQRTW